MPSPGIEPLSTLIHRFSELHPGVTVSTQAAFTPEEVVSLVRGGACELGLLGSAEPVTAPGVDVLPVEEQPFVVVAAPGGTIRASPRTTRTWRPRAFSSTPCRRSSS